MGADGARSSWSLPSRATAGEVLKPRVIRSRRENFIVYAWFDFSSIAPRRVRALAYLPESVSLPTFIRTGRIFKVTSCVTGGAMERGARKPRELAAGTAALRSAGLRPASSGGFQPPVSVVLSKCAHPEGQS